MCTGRSAPPKWTNTSWLRVHTCVMHARVSIYLFVFSLFFIFVFDYIFFIVMFVS